MPVPVTEFRTELEDDGTALILFTGDLANVGEGALLLDGAETEDGWIVTQRIEQSQLGVREVETPATVVFGGDDHVHWHIERIASYSLENADGTPLDAIDSKVGFCFFDHSRLDDPPESSPEDGFHTSDGCGERADREFRMGLSVGWIDSYPWFLQGQEIEVTGLPAGTYRIVATVDPEGWFQEVSTTNNHVATTFELIWRESDGAPVVVAESVTPDEMPR